MSEKPNFQMSADARLLYHELRKVEPGTTITYSTLEAAVSRPLSAIRGALRTAIHRALRDDGMVFANVRGVGYLRCNDEAIVDQSTSDTAVIRRAARRSAEKLTKVENFAVLPLNKQIEHTTRLSIASAIAAMTKEAAVAKVRVAAQGRSSQLPLSETMKAFVAV